MARRMGLLSVSMAALGLAVAAYFVQGAGAGSTPVQVADFGDPQAAVAEAASGGEYEMLPGDSALFHPAAMRTKPACIEGSGLGLVAISDDVAILCKDDKVLGYVVTAESGETKLIDSIKVKDECPSKKDEHHPDA